MGNSTLVALALFALFLVYITARGRLPQYLAVFFGQVTSDQVTSNQAPNTVVTAPGGTPGTSATGTVGPLQTSPVAIPGTDTALPGGFAIQSFTDILPSAGTGGLY